MVNIHTLEQDLRLELFGRPLHENSSTEWVAIVRPYRDEQEVEAAWQTRIAMEEAARIDAETSLETFESGLIGTLLPTTSDVSLIHSRQDDGTWHIVRPLDSRTCVYAVGAVTARNRSQAVIDGTIAATIADVLASQALDVNEYLEMVRDHCRARDIETTLAAVRVIDGTIAAATFGGASVYISGKSFVGVETIDATTAFSLSTHSEATPETIDVAANGRPWRIMSTVLEVVSIIETPDSVFAEDLTEHTPEPDSEITPHEDLGKITGSDSSKNVDPVQPNNVSQFRSGSISAS